MPAILCEVVGFEITTSPSQVKNFEEISGHTLSENDGRPEWIRTIDLFRVKEAL
jgi:hypothetical protein